MTDSKTKRIETMTEIRLVPASEKHAEFWFELREEPQAVQFNPMDLLSVAQLRQRLNRAGHDLSDRSVTDFRWMIEAHDASTGWSLAGTVSLVANWKMLHAEVGYHVATSFWNRGVGTRAVRKLVSLAFADDSPIYRLFAFIAQGNTASIRLIEHVGFQHEGTLRDHYRIGSRHVTELVYGLLRDEWDRTSGP